MKVKTLVLIGGGHSHAIALRKWGSHPLLGVNLILISDTLQTPYSGMLPGHVAGYYSYEETHINLVTLSKFAQTQLYLDQAIGIDLKQRQVVCAQGTTIDYDYLSIDIGSTPDIASIPGAQQYGVAAKPVEKFLQVWQQLVTKVKANPAEDINIVLVGGGAGGVELAINIHERLCNLKVEAKIYIHLYHRNQQLLPQHNPWVVQRLYECLKEKGIQLHLGEEVVEVTSKVIRCASGLTREYQGLFWVTHASAPLWVRDSGLTVDERGFILVEDTLQSLSHPEVFATGDIATMKNYPRPKAGVFAVRQGKPLEHNWRCILTGKPLKRYVPQRDYLSLIGIGHERAIASRGNWGWESPLLWQLKERIDRRFMEQFKFNVEL